MSYENSPYYHPERLGLETVAELGEYDYEWDIAMVWRHTETGDLYYGRDSGCSCYGPFEQVDDLGGLERLHPEQIEQRALELATGYNPVSLEAVHEFMRKVRDAQSVS